jgi:hypothetical protein
MHLTEVGGALRQRSEFDPRLAVIFPKGQIAKSRRPRLSEFLGKDELKPLFRVVESRLRQSEKVSRRSLATLKHPQMASKQEMIRYSLNEMAIVTFMIQVVTLRTEVLLRSLGPMASLLQKSLVPVAKEAHMVTQEAPRSAKDSNGQHTPSFPLPIPALGDQPHAKGVLIKTVQTCWIHTCTYICVCQLQSK